MKSEAQKTHAHLMLTILLEAWLLMDMKRAERERLNLFKWEDR